MALPVRRGVAAALVSAAAALCAACGGGGAAGHAGPTAQSSPTVVSTDVRNLTRDTRTDSATEGQYLTQVAELDDDLRTYASANGQVGVQALLTDGQAFCAFLEQGAGIDNAMVSVAQGAQSRAATTHLPSSVETFNTIDSVALLTLCPAELPLVPPATQTQLRSLQHTLTAGAAPGAAPSP